MFTTRNYMLSCLPLLACFALNWQQMWRTTNTSLEVKSWQVICLVHLEPTFIPGESSFRGEIPDSSQILSGIFGFSNSQVFHCRNCSNSEHELFSWQNKSREKMAVSFLPLPCLQLELQARQWCHSLMTPQVCLQEVKFVLNQSERITARQK